MALTGGGTGSKGGGKGKGRSPKPQLRLVGPDTGSGSETGGDRSETGLDGGDLGTLSQGGETGIRRPKVRGPVLPGINVTAKEEAFARLVAKGSTLTDAYRATHDASGMKKDTASRQAVRIDSRDRVRDRIEILIEAGEGSALHDRRKALSWALERLEHEALHAETDGARIAAVSLIMRHHSLLTDKIETEVVDGRDSTEVEAALKERLTRLLKAG
jgi:hypothetical protein